jgi:chromosome partitioning protein
MKERKRLSASARVVAFIGQKGGCGKSTLATNLAAEGVARGRRVLLVDADTQRTARQWADAALGAKRRVPTVVEMNATMAEPGQLGAMVGSYDLVIIDCPGRHDETQGAALMLADVAVLPCQPSSADAWALAGSVALVRRAKVLRPELRAVVAINRKKARTALGRAARDGLAACGLPVLATEVCDRVAYQEALGFGLGVGQYDRGEAALEMRKLFDEVVEADRG